MKTIRELLFFDLEIVCLFMQAKTSFVGICVLSTLLPLPTIPDSYCQTTLGIRERKLCKNIFPRAQNFRKYTEAIKKQFTKLLFIKCKVTFLVLLFLACSMEKNRTASL